MEASVSVAIELDSLGKGCIESIGLVVVHLVVRLTWIFRNPEGLEDP